MISEEECLRIGGHCWNYHSANDVVNERGEKTGISDMVFYPYGEPQHRICKHCRKHEVLNPEEWK